MNRMCVIILFGIFFYLLFYSSSSMALDWRDHFRACQDNRTKPHLNLDLGHIKIISTSEVNSPREVGRAAILVPMFSNCRYLFPYGQEYSITGVPEYTPGINGRTLDIGIPGIVAAMTHAGQDNVNHYEYPLVGDYSPSYRYMSKPGPTEGRLGLILYQIGPVAPGVYSINASNNAVVATTYLGSFVDYGNAKPTGTIEVFVASCEFEQSQKTISFGKVAWEDDMVESEKVKFSLGLRCNHSSPHGVITFSANDGSSDENIYLNKGASMAKNVAVRLYDEHGQTIKVNSPKHISLTSGQNLIELQTNLVKLAGDVVPGKIEAVATVNVTYQ